MDISSRRPLHTKTSSQEYLSDNMSLETKTTDESVVINSDSKVTNKHKSPNLSSRDRDFKTKSPSPAEKITQVVPESQVGRKRKKSPIKHQNNKETVGSKETTGKSCFRLCLCTCLVVFFLLTFISMCLFARTSKTSTVKNCNYSELRPKYKNQDDYLWEHLTSGIENILNDRSDKPAVFLFVHSGGHGTKKLIKDIAETSSTCFDSSMKPAEIETFDFTSKEAISDYGYVIKKYKQKIQEGNVILIANLNKIPGEAARALHVICDTYSPIVPKVIIFLSLEAEHKGERVADTAQEVLRRLWEQTISYNELDPLIARVTDEVILLQSN